jgi:hypothetical protein
VLFELNGELASLQETLAEQDADKKRLDDERKALALQKKQAAAADKAAALKAQADAAAAKKKAEAEAAAKAKVEREAAAKAEKERKAAARVAEAQALANAQADYERILTKLNAATDPDDIDAFLERLTELAGLLYGAEAANAAGQAEAAEQAAAEAAEAKAEQERQAKEDKKEKERMAKLTADGAAIEPRMRDRAKEIEAAELILEEDWYPKVDDFDYELTEAEFNEFERLQDALWALYDAQDADGAALSRLNADKASAEKAKKDAEAMAKKA